MFFGLLLGLREGLGLALRVPLVAVLQKLGFREARGLAPLVPLPSVVFGNVTWLRATFLMSVSERHSCSIIRCQVGLRAHIIHLDE
jgi:hypothetical protein